MRNKNILLVAIFIIAIGVLVTACKNNVGGKAFVIPQTSEPFKCNKQIYDYDNDGKTTKEDVDFLLEIAIGIRKCPEKKDCDINDDGKITSLDASFYLQQLEINKCDSVK